MFRQQKGARLIHCIGAVSLALAITLIAVGIATLGAFFSKPWLNTPKTPVCSATVGEGER